MFQTENKPGTPLSASVDYIAMNKTLHPNGLGVMTSFR